MDFCNPMTFHKARGPPPTRNIPSSSAEKPTQGKSKTKGEKRKGKKTPEEEYSEKKTVRKAWYEAHSPEGYTYYWNVDTNGKSSLMHLFFNILHYLS